MMFVELAVTPRIPDGKELIGQTDDLHTVVARDLPVSCRQART